MHTLKLNLKRICSDDHILSMSSNVISSAIGALSIILLARFSTSHDFGMWFFFITIANLFEMVKFGFINNPAVRFISSSTKIIDICELRGSAWLLSILVSICLLMPFFCLIKFSIINLKPELELPLMMLPLYSLLYSPIIMTISFMTTKGRFGVVLIVKVLWSILFLAGIIIGILTKHLQGSEIFVIQIFSMIPLLLITTFSGWSHIKDIFQISKKSLTTLFHFGKYSFMTFLSANLLKTSDTFLIGVMMSNEAVAMYAIPLKLIESVEIIINSIGDVALPKISRNSFSKKAVRLLYSKYAGVSIIGLSPVIVLMFIFSEELICLFGGSKYLVSNISVNVMRIFLIYLFFMILDRFSGITLDGINKPNLNFFKVAIMAVLNIIGDIIAIKYFNSIEYVAVVTILNAFSGTIIGILFLKSEIALKFTEIFIEGSRAIRIYISSLFDKNFINSK